MLRRVHVTSLFAAGKWRPAPGEHYVVISLQDHGKPSQPLPKRPGFVKRLIIRADDSSPDEDFVDGERAWHSLTVEQAADIATFAIDMRMRADVLLIHCVAGLSRSPAVAVAIAEAFGIEDLEIASQDAIPNAHVLRLVREALRIEMR